MLPEARATEVDDTMFRTSWQPHCCCMGKVRVARWRVTCAAREFKRVSNEAGPPVRVCRGIAGAMFAKKAAKGIEKTWISSFQVA